MDRIKALLQKYREIIMYVIIGGCTTLVDWGIFTVMMLTGAFSGSVANAVSVVLAVIFAYITNKIYVFRTRCPTRKALFREMFSFFSFRALTTVVAIGGYPPAAALLLRLFPESQAVAGYYEFITKGFLTVFILILNYILSKLIIFRDQKGAEP